MNRPVGIPPGCYRVHAEPDPLPSELGDFPPAVVADWIAADLRRRPAAAPQPEPEPVGQLAFDA